MSRIGRLPVTVPAGVEVKINGLHVHVKGPKGELEYQFNPEVKIEREGDDIIVTRLAEEAPVDADLVMPFPCGLTARSYRSYSTVNH